MGTWGDGLYDNDSALDLVAALTEVGEQTDATTLVTRIGLAAWLDPSAITCASDELRAAVATHAAEIAALPPGTREGLAGLLADPEGSTRDGSRSERLRGVIGGYCDGPRIDALLRFAGAQPVIDAVGEEAAEILDRACAPSSRDLHEIAGELAALGLVVELVESGLWRPTPGRVAAWRRGVAEADQRTTEEREFWDLYARRVGQALELAG